MIETLSYDFLTGRAHVQAVVNDVRVLVQFPLAHDPGRTIDDLRDQLLAGARRRLKEFIERGSPQSR